MSESSEFDDIASGVVEQYQLFLRGRGPEPDLAGLTGDQQAAIRDQLDIVEALADRGPALPPLGQDPVAIRLGLVDDPPPETGGSASLATDSAHGSHTGHGDVWIRGVLEGLEHRFDGNVTVNYAPVWASWTRDRLAPLAQCSALGNTLALFESPLDTWADEPESVAVFLRQYPDISAVGLVSADAGQAVIVTAADSNRCIDPVRGWLEPGSAAVPDAFEHALDRYFERRLPRWDRVADLDEMLDISGFTSDAVTITENEIAAALRARPRLAHKKQALQALARLDPMLLAAVIVEVQTTGLTGDQLVERLVRLGETAAP